MSESPAGLFRGLFETHVQVKDLEEAMRFYGDILGLELGLRETERRVAFYWIGGKGRTVIGLWEKPPWVPFDTGNPILPQHLAFEVNFDDLATAIERVKRRGVELRNFSAKSPMSRAYSAGSPALRFTSMTLMDICWS